MPGKHVTMVSPTPARAMLGSLATTRAPVHGHVMLLLSMKTGLRAQPWRPSRG
jgi:hypothetical protein